MNVSRIFMAGRMMHLVFNLATGLLLVIHLGDFFGPDLILREKMGERMELPGTHGHPCYTRSGWMKSLGIPEHAVLWPFMVCSMMAAILAGIGLLLR